MILHVIMVFCRLAMYGGNAAYEFSFYVYMVSIFYKKRKKKDKMTLERGCIASKCDIVRNKSTKGENLKKKKKKKYRNFINRVC